MPLFGPNVKKMLENADLNGLLSVLDHKDGKYRLQAAEALGKQGKPEAIRPLILQLRDSDPKAAQAAADSLNILLQIGEHLNTLVSLTADRDSFVSENAVKILGSMDLKENAQAFLYYLSDESYDTLIAALGSGNVEKVKISTGILTVTREVSVERMLVAVTKENSSTEVVMHVLGAWKEPDAIDPIIRRIGDTRVNVGSILEALRRFEGQADEPLFQFLVKNLQDSNDEEKQITACDVFGLLKSKRALKPLAAALQDPKYEVGKAAVSALQDIGDDGAIPFLCSAVIQKTGVGQAAASALKKLGWKPDQSEAAIAYYIWNDEYAPLEKFSGNSVIRQLIDKGADSPYNQEKIVDVLKGMGSERVFPLLLEALLAVMRGNKEDWRKQFHQQEIENMTKKIASIHLLSEAFSTASDPELRLSLIKMIGEMEGTKAVELLVAAAQDSETNIRRVAVAALANMDQPRLFDALLAGLKDPDAQVRDSAAYGLGRLYDPRAVQSLIVSMKTEENPVPMMKALDKFQDESIAEALIPFLTNPLDEARHTASDMLYRMYQSDWLSPATKQKILSQNVAMTSHSDYWESHHVSSDCPPDDTHHDEALPVTLS
jgi:HEAT repeat protein